MPARLVIVGLCVSAMCAAVTPAAFQEREKAHSAAEENKRFQDPALDVGTFQTRFESDSRDIFVQRRKIVEALGLRPGMAVADIGAGTGLFAWMFAEKIGPEGKVYAVEIAPAFLKHIGDQARKRGLEGVVKTIRGTQDTTNLAPDSVDVAFVCATYHHFEHPERVLASIHRALRPDGRLVVIDFDLRENSDAFVRGHARAPKEVYFKEIQAAGFTPAETKPPVALKDNFFAIFRRAELEANPCRSADES
jgi:SAM-dependent methyltransferase